ncbi:TatD family hydrolase [Saliphagus infecundisoli]|uniref:TatD family hydrolase n=1 Tax=Saliphagus infecundisoli TaxID=1849069 RepID=A0ABD5QK55_9EURY|nr:TatD family hydrolase [Saliphagus infecundisoli]
MTDPDTPVLDNHLHLNPDNGRGLAAVDDFRRLGGTHLIVVNKPSWHLGQDVEGGEEFRPVFDRTLDVVAEAADRLPGTAWPVLGVHPGLVTRLVDDRGLSPERAGDLMIEGLELAADYVAEGEALGLKSGRPHYDVPEAVWEASNRVMRRAFSLGADLDCAVQLHTEESEDLTVVAGWAEEAGLPAHRVVKHYASGRLAGPTPSVMSEKDWLREAAERGDPFLMETDFVDDPDRPGAVLGPKTVPRRVDWLEAEGHAEAIRTAHVETPRLVYGVDTEATLDPGGENG